MEDSVLEDLDRFVVAWEAASALWKKAHDLHDEKPDTSLPHNVYEEQFAAFIKELNALDRAGGEAYMPCIDMMDAGFGDKETRAEAVIVWLYRLAFPNGRIK